MKVGSYSRYLLEPAEGDKFTALLTLPKGNHEFTVASEDWKTVDLGSIGIDAGTDDGVPQMVCSAGANLTPTVAEPARYRPTLDTTGGTSMQLSVSKVQ